MKFVFLDRDGVVNKDVGFLHRINDIYIFNSTIRGLKLLKDDFSFVIVTNQAGIARGLYSDKQFHIVNNTIVDILKQNDIKILKTYYCPHDLDSSCECRKPLPGMLESAIVEFGIDRSESWILGDRDTDIQAGIAAGISGIKISSDHTVEDAARFILRNK